MSPTNNEYRLAKLSEGQDELREDVQEVKMSITEALEIGLSKVGDSATAFLINYLVNLPLNFAFSTILFIGIYWFFWFKRISKFLN